MSTALRPSPEIDGKGRTGRELLAGRKYSIDYCQREYNGHAQFRRADLDARQALYQRLAERIWDPAVLDEEAA